MENAPEHVPEPVIETLDDADEVTLQATVDYVTSLLDAEADDVVDEEETIAESDPPEEWTGNVDDFQDMSSLGGESGHVGQDYEHRPLSAFETNSEKPGQRWELSPQLGIEAYNFNVAVIESGERLSQNAYHYHEHQTEFFYVVAGRCRVEVANDSFDCETDDAVLFDEGAVHLLHNPFDDPCKVVAVGHPPEGRYPVEKVQSYEALLEDRYGATPE